MDLNQHIRLLREAGDLLVVNKPVDPHLEISALSARAVCENGPALFFARPLGSQVPILTNTFASPGRLALALNQTTLDDFGATAHALLQEPRMQSTPHLPVNSNPSSQEVIHFGSKAHFGLLPSMTFWPGDAGPCLTAAVVITRHPENGHLNAGLYRIQVIASTKALLGWHPGSGGDEHFTVARRLHRPLEVAVALGAPPAVTLAASFPLPGAVNEFAFAAHFSPSSPGQALMKLAQARTVDLLIPAESQVILEGHVDPEHSSTEGPFANHAGRLSDPRQSPVFHLHAVTHVHQPVFQAVMAGPPPSESCWMAKAFEPVLRRQVMSRFADVQDISLPLEGIFQNFCFVRVADLDTEPLDLLEAMLQHPGVRRFRYLVAVDESVDVRETSSVLWRVGNCVDPAKDIRVLDGPLAPWHDSPTPGHGAKVLVDATLKKRHRPLPKHPDPGFQQRIHALWEKIKG